MKRSSQTTAPLSIIKHALRRRDRHCMHRKQQNLTELMQEHLSNHTRTLEKAISEKSVFFEITCLWHLRSGQRRRDLRNWTLHRARPAPGSALRQVVL